MPIARGGCVLRSDLISDPHALSHSRDRRSDVEIFLNLILVKLGLRFAAADRAEQFLISINLANGFLATNLP